MKMENFIPLNQLSSYYEVELSFFINLSEIGLIEITMIDQAEYVHESNVERIERIIRMHNDLQVNPEGIDVVFNLLQKIEDLQEELRSAKNRLRLYEH